MKKVLVTGANGLLGSHIVRELISNGYDVRVLVRKKSNLKAIEGLKIEVLYGDISEENDSNSAITGCDYVIHSAAKTSQESNLESFRKVNIESVSHIIEACKRFKIKRLVYVSSANCFGNGTKENPGTEQNPFLPWLKKSGYAYSKFLAQEKVLNEAKKGNLNAVVVNPTFIIGEHDIKPSSGQIFAHVLNKKIAFYPSGGKNFVDAKEAARTIVKAIHNGSGGESYLLGGENHAYLDFFKIVKKITGQKTILIPIPKTVLLLTGFLGSVFEGLFGVTVQLTYTNAKMLCLGNYYTPRKAIENLELKIVPTKNAAEKAVKWFQKNDYFIKN